MDQVTFKYSPSTGNFYPDNFEYLTIPPDLIQVEVGGYEKAMSRRPDQTFQVDPEGKVTLLDPTQEDIAKAALANFKVMVEDALRTTREKALTYFMTATPFPAEWVAYSQALVALQSSDTVQDLPTPPSV